MYIQDLAGRSDLLWPCNLQIPLLQIPLKIFVRISSYVNGKYTKMSIHQVLNLIPTKVGICSYDEVKTFAPSACYCVPYLAHHTNMVPLRHKLPMCNIVIYAPNE